MSNHYVTIHNQKYLYKITPQNGGVSKFVCKDANIDQVFANEDIPELLRDLLFWIIDAQKVDVKTTTVRFRLSQTEKKALQKKALQKKALKKGYDNLSDYLRVVALTE